MSFISITINLRTYKKENTTDKAQGSKISKTGTRTLAFVTRPDPHLTKSGGRAMYTDSFVSFGALLDDPCGRSTTHTHPVGNLIRRGVQKLVHCRSFAPVPGECLRFVCFPRC
jgi:hypothetical protein